MLYMAECRFTEPTREDAWNEWYGGRRLDELLSVPGFRTSQRFKAVTPGSSPYLAVHSIDSPDVFTSAAYRSVSGGGFQEWQQYITDWRRNLFDGLDLAPAVALDEYLVVTDKSSAEVGAIGISFIWLASAGLDRSVRQRGIASIDSSRAKDLTSCNRCALDIFVPLMPQKP